MSQGTELNIASQRQPEELDSSMRSATRSQEPSQTQTTSTAHEISKESIEVTQVAIRRDGTGDTELSNHLEQYREKLHRSSQSTVSPLTKTTDKSVEQAHNATLKSASVGSKKNQKGKRGARPEVSILEDPIGFLANLLTKLERALLRSLQGDKALPVPPASQQQAVVVPQLKKRKKKKDGLFGKGPHRGTQLTTLYHLEHLNNELHALDVSSEQSNNEATQSKN